MCQHYNESSLTDSTSQPTALTGVTDEMTSRYSSFGYDNNGRAASTSHAGGVGTYTVVSNVVTDPLGAQRTYSSTNIATYASDSSAASSLTASTGITKPDSSGVSMIG